MQNGRLLTQLAQLRQAIGQWCERRFNVPGGWLDADRHILPVNGTREALFAFTQAVVNRADDAASQIALTTDYFNALAAGLPHAHATADAHVAVAL